MTDTILVTGSEGSLMQATIPVLLESGYRVIGVDNQSRHGPVSRSRDYEFVPGDLSDEAFVSTVVSRCTGVIQAAATIYGVGGFHRHPGTILANDLMVHAAVLRQAVRHGLPRVAYISSSMVYERCEHDASIEDDVCLDLLPRTDYGLSKAVGERMSKAFAEEFGVEYVIWRPFNVITPFEPAEGEQGISHVFADFIGTIVERRQTILPVIGDGQQVRCFTWIDDVAAAIGTFSFAPVARNTSFNLGNPRPVTMLELARLIHERAQAAGVLPHDARLAFHHRPTYADDVRHRVPSVQRAEELLGWSPTLSLEQALDRCIAAHAAG